MNLKITSKRFLASLFILTLIGISYDSITYSSGGPASLTNAPGEGNCTSCHSGTLQTSGTNYNNITFSGPFTGSGYIPDSVYDVTLSYSHTGKSKFGFSATVLDDNDDFAGTLASINSAVSTINGTVSGGTRTYVRHTSSGTSGTNGRSWTFRWTAPSSNVGDVTLYAIVNATNSGNNNSGDIIIAKEFTISPSSLLPTAIASKDTTICQGNSVTLMGSGTNSPTSYLWSIVGASPSSSTSQNPSVVFNNPGTYNAILRVNNAKGSSAPDTAVITVSQGPTAFIGGGANRTLCEGDSIQITANLLAGQSYTWNNGATGNQIWAKDSGDYFVTVVGSNGCAKVSNTISVSYLPKPAATLSSNASVFNDSSCTNSTIILEASSAAFDSFYYYADGVLLATTATSTYTTAFDSTTTYGLQVKNSNGCKSDLSTYVVNAKNKQSAPVVNCSIRTPSSVEYTFSSVFGHQGFQVSIDSGFTWITPSSGSLGTKHLVTGMQPEDSLELYVRSIDNAPCFYSFVGKETCAADTCSQLSATYQLDSAYCLGDIATMEINGLAGKHFGISFEGGADFNDTIFQFQPTITKNYTLAITDSNNLFCPAREIVIPIRVDQINDINLQPAKLGAYCPGDTVTYTANDTLDNFNFFVNGSSVQNGSSPVYSSTNLETGDVVFVIVNKGVCTDSSQKETVNIESPADASFSFNRVGSVYTFSPTINTYAGYEWDFGEGNSSSDVSPTNDFSSSEGQTVTISLTVTTSNGCTNTFTETVTLPMFSSVSNFAKLGLFAYPNPVEDFLIVKNESGKSGSLKLIGLDGKEALSQDIIGFENRIDLKGMPTGVYQLQVDIDGKTAIMQVIKNN